MFRIANAAMFILAFLAVHSHGQQLVAAEKNDVREILSGYHDIPGPDYWKRLDPVSARTVLIELSSDKNEMVHIRTRAAMALANFPDGQVEQHLISLFTRQDRGYVRAAALKAYSNISGQASVPVLEKALEDKDDMVKISAIRSLGAVGGDQAAQILARRMEVEHDPVVKDAFKKALSKAARP